VKRFLQIEEYHLVSPNSVKEIDQTAQGLTTRYEAESFIDTEKVEVLEVAA